jgi:hypothetical protein
MFSCRGPKEKSIVRSFEAIIEYAERIHRCYYPDFELWEL